MPDLLDTTAPPTIAQVNALQPFQGLWNGLTFGEGTNYLLTAELAGLLAYESRLADSPIPQGEGDFSFSRYAASRFVSLPFIISGVPLSATLEDRVQTWLRSFGVAGTYGQGWLVFKGVSKAYMWRCRVARRRASISPESLKTGAVSAVAELKLADPRIYNALTRPGGVVPVGAASGGGFDLDTDLPIDMTGTTGGSLTANNGGTSTAWPVLQISNDAGAGSDITEAVVTNVTAGIIFTIETAIAAGKTLVVNFDKLQRRAPAPHISIDGVSRYGDWQHPREPLPILAGSNSFTADITGGTPTVRLDWYDTSL